MAKQSRKAKNLADALAKVAKANHYMVGLNAEAVGPWEPDDIWGARDRLIDMENAGKLSEEQAGIAFELLTHYFGNAYR